MATALSDTLEKLDLGRSTNGKPTAEDGVSSSGAASDAGGGSDAEADDDPSPDAGSSSKKKKKKKPKKKKTAAADAGVPLVQSEPPRVGLGKIFLDGVFPVGEEEEYREE